ncbi:hypothetical protein Q5P01_002834 [Channa striata]|uniref:C-type lectin domain-containing protein n=1 Tax=Channa striata TaxID=64152 RepID=A0AA88NN90_CHASR|nr:hypothetical protein Q5P01_002834 [Channa striata]
MKIPTVFVLGFAVMALARAAQKNDLAKRYWWCSSGWTYIGGACFKYVPTAMTWAIAENNCRSMSSHLASVQSIDEYHSIQKMIADATHEYKQTWIGGSDAQHDGVWLWSDGETMKFTKWCKGEPNNRQGSQHCLQMNHGDQKCWDDSECNVHLPSVCVQRGSFWG